MTAQVHYMPQGNTLREFHRSDKWWRTIIGPLGSGKTRACLTEVLIQINGQRPDENGVRKSRIAIIRNSYPDLINTVVKDFAEVVEEAGVGTLKQTAPPTWNANYKLPDGTKVDAEILFLSFDSPADAKKARGLQLSGAYFNELKELSKENVDMVEGRVGRYPPKSQVKNARSFLIADSNAPDRDHWVARQCFDEKHGDREFFVQPGGVIKDGKEWKLNRKAENVHNLPDRYYERLAQGKKESWIRQNLANEFVYHSDGRPVHPDFSETIHVEEIEISPALPLTIGIDFGRTPAAAICQKQADGRWFVLDEICTENMSALKFGELLRDFLAKDDYRNLPFEAIGDPAGNQMAQTRDETPFDMLKQKGIRAVPAPTNDFEERTTVLDVLLTKLSEGEPAIKVHPRCKTLIRGLVGDYQFKRLQVAGERYQDKPLKNDVSHVCEALHYGLLGGGEGILTKRKSREEIEAFNEEYRRIREKSHAVFE
ncbi:TerL [Seongchinamella unica]|uniref:TerL n=1 Tax=Seongchinamella unica TaxID=2547392 RepID=A0A4R5LT95_9GAMM|nr:phage terminase large subunit [Seongchinamella unica]TDG13977.1 TerL [Seongchinamella unica]